MTRPITEQSNPLTRNMDVADPIGMIRLLRQSDAMMFTGFDVHPALTDEEVMETLALAGYRLAQVISSPDAVVFMSGAGTSGRLAYMLCIEFNRVLRERRMAECFKPLMAGGEAALIQAQEAAEDSTAAAVKDVKDVLATRDFKRGMYFGITCGLSAPYVAAQLDFLGGNARFESAMIGFNPIALARDMPIEGWDKTVKQVIEKALESQRFILINPVYGPESITGSTRMKGGSLTKIVLEIIFSVALEVLDNEEREGEARQDVSEEYLLPLRDHIVTLVHRYRRSVQAAYGNIPALAELVRMAGSSLRSGGRIHYLGRGIAGLMGVIDASECPPTFGANLFDVRGYIYEGWEFLGYTSSTMKSRGRAYEVSHEDFEQAVLPELSRGDLVIGICTGVLGENARRLLVAATQARAWTALIFVGTDKPKASDLPEGLSHLCFIEVPSMGFIPGTNNEAELALKLCLNAVTTCGHTIAGKIFGNVMIDLRISNNKLYHRAIGLVSRLTSVSQEDARRALHQAIFKQEATDAEIEATPVGVSVQRAVSRSKIVPLAILLATRKFTLAEAEERLAGEPRVRRIIEEVIGNSQQTQF